eukprot:m.279409 g.279409  ORF g.279409 m.279409 type:complete len:256 (-) comp100982_c0_seq1:53-820(-)
MCPHIINTIAREKIRLEIGGGGGKKIIREVVGDEFVFVLTLQNESPTNEAWEYLLYVDPESYTHDENGVTATPSFRLNNAAWATKRDTPPIPAQSSINFEIRVLKPTLRLNERVRFPSLRFVAFSACEYGLLWGPGLYKSIDTSVPVDNAQFGTQFEDPISDFVELDLTFLPIPEEEIARRDVHDRPNLAPPISEPATCIVHRGARNNTTRPCYCTAHCNVCIVGSTTCATCRHGYSLQNGKCQLDVHGVFLHLK